MRPASALVLLSSLAFAGVSTAGARAHLATEQDKTLYALGVLISRNLDAFQLTPQELELVKAGLDDGIRKEKPLVDVDKYGPQLEELHRTRLAAVTARETAAGKAYLEKAAAEKGAVRTPSGIVMTTLKAGTGATPKPTDEVKVQYEGRLIDGQVFDSSIERGEPATFPLNGVIPCWTEALQHMKVGGKSRFVCPAELAYGEQGSPPVIRGGAALIFDVELLDIVKSPQQQP